LISLGAYPDVTLKRVVQFGLVHVNWGISGDLDPDGTARKPRNGIFSWLLVKQTDGTWLIRSVQNTNLPQ
jgi:hypothetical protein